VGTVVESLTNSFELSGGVIVGATKRPVAEQSGIVPAALAPPPWPWQTDIPRSASATDDFQEARRQAAPASTDFPSRPMHSPPEIVDDFWFDPLRRFLAAPLLAGRRKRLADSATTARFL
jgi:hypothetical protein